MNISIPIIMHLLVSCLACIHIRRIEVIRLSKHLYPKQFRITYSVAGMQKVVTAGTNGTGKQKVIWGEEVSIFYIFLYISEGKFAIYSCCGTIYFATFPKTFRINRENLWTPTFLTFCIAGWHLVFKHSDWGFTIMTAQLSIESIEYMKKFQIGAGYRSHMTPTHWDIVRRRF